MNEQEMNTNREAEETVEKIKELVKKGNIARIIIKKGEDTIVNLPLNVGIIGGIVGAVAAPWAMLTATIATIGFDCRIELVKDDGSIIDISGKTVGRKIMDVGSAVVDDITDTGSGDSENGNADGGNTTEVNENQKVLTFQADEIKSLRICCKIFRIHVVGGQADEIVFRYTDTKRRKLEVKNVSGNIEVSDKAGVAIYGMFNLIELMKQNEMFVEIPAGFSGSLMLESSGETVALDDLDIKGDISVWTTASKIECRNISGRNIELTSNSGSVCATTVQPQNQLHMATTVGSIECSLCGDARDYQITCQSEHGICNAPSQNGNGSKLVSASSVTGQINIAMSTYRPE